MRQASWEELFAPREQPPLVLAPEVPQEPQGWRRLLWWEDLLTFALLGVVFLAVVGSIDQAGWVDDMPSLYPIAFLGLAMGALLARLRWQEGFVHLLALSVGAGAVLGQVLAVVPGSNPWDRLQTLEQRMDDWFGVAFGGGISNDGLPFIILVVALSWLAAYLSSWAVFRWQNAWLGLIPGGWALLANISYLPSRFSFAFVIFLFGGALLVARLHLMERARAWRRDGTPYPGLISLSVLHTTFWVVLLLVVVAWLLPQANETGAMESLWRRATAPVAERMEGLGRLFVSVNSKTEIRVHSFDDTLPFQGGITLPDTLVLDVTTESLGQPRYLRERSYDVYGAAGWRQQGGQSSSLERFEITAVDRQLRLREVIAIRVAATEYTGNIIFTVGQPRRIDRAATLRFGEAEGDVTVVEAKEGLATGTVYEAVGSISAAPEEALRAAGAEYPAWVRDRYLQLPEELPARVGRLAEDLSRLQPTPYDKATAIEAYLRTIPYDLDVPDTPLGRDTIDYFLFEVQRGYFDYHASAMVVMLRSLGIPSRLAVGYVLEEPDREGDTNRYLVTERNAFAWPEVYFPGLGWVEFNPTPNLPLIERPGAEPGAISTTGDESTAPRGDLTLEELLALFPGEEGEASVGASREASGERIWWPLFAVLAGLAVVSASLTGGLRYAWVRGLTDLEPPARLWGQTLRLGSWARMRPAPSQTPSEYARVLREQVPGLDDVDLLADAYVRHRFGRRRPGAAEGERLEGAWRAVRGRLLRRLLRLG